MSANSFVGEARDIYRALVKQGWLLERHTGSGVAMMRHPTGATVTVPHRVTLACAKKNIARNAARAIAASKPSRA